MISLSYTSLDHNLHKTFKTKMSLNPVLPHPNVELVRQMFNVEMLMPWRQEYSKHVCTSSFDQACQNSFCFVHQSSDHTLRANLVNSDDLKHTLGPAQDTDI